jgi:mercuric ion binding protein
MKKLFLLALALALSGPLRAASSTTTLSVSGWTCGSCAVATRVALKKLDGVEDVKTDLERMEATVTYDDAKVTPAKLIREIEKLGYRATAGAVAPAAASPDSRQSAVVKAPGSPEHVSFFEVSLECGAVEGLGCGSASKPVLKSLGHDARIADAKVNYAGTLLAVVWKDPAQSVSGAAAVGAAFEKRGLEAALLQGSAREKALKEFDSQWWYRAPDVDHLSEREAQVIASRLVNRARASLDLPPEKLAALTADLSRGISATLTMEKGEECARDPLEGLTKIASKYLSPTQLGEFRKAAMQGAGALPGEAR